MTYRRRSGECDLECCDGPKLRDEIERLTRALKEIVAIEHQEFGPDYEEIEQAQKIARRALGLKD